ncbi:MAG: hypothetical protein NTZ39_02250 [Methanoregula sp.]|nr:hypothetical protein [Methanoregula sp.]
MKKILVVLAVLFIGILLAGCTTQPAAPVATPTPTPVPTTVATVAPTPVVTTNVTVIVIKPVVNVTANVTAVPTAVPTYIIRFTQDLTIVPSTYARVPVGTTVVWWDNDPYKDHTLQATGVQSGPYFGTGTVAIPHDGNYSVLFDKVGSYDYTSVYQPVMPGTIVVY